MIRFANLDNYTVEELITEVEDYYPELHTTMMDSL